MRRMRELSIGHYVAFAVPVLAAAFGIHYLVRHHHMGASHKDATAMKQDAKGSRKIASAGGEKDGVQIGSRHEGDSAEAESERNLASHQLSNTVLEGAVNDAVSTGKDCASIEYRGEGPKLTKVTRADWNVVMDQFHGAKNELLGWLKTHRHELPEPTVTAMERQVSNLKIQRPPAAEEPDLSWRGVGIYSQNSEGESIVKLGGGFVKLAEKHPGRARFEMARLVAQSWAPCELHKVASADVTWTPLLKCLGLNESQGCGQGTYSESGWAVSTTLAAAVSAPGCKIPAFKSPELAKCLERIPLPKATAEQGHGAAERYTAALEGDRQ